MKIYNSLTNKKEEFQPIKPGEVNIYACGITAYDECHLGHLRSAVVFDVIRNFLKYKGYKVRFIKNITDVDDKIINKARDVIEDKSLGIADLNSAAKFITEKYTNMYYEDMEKFHIEKADIEPRATEHIAEMIKMIELLIKKGHAYVSGGDVYFSVSTFPAYGKLSNQNIDKLKEGARISPGEQKRDALDFALWKKVKEGEPSWDSPWGKGRPGWHIECSVMSTKYLGDTFDIHGGGRDLIFPHHENEVAQAEAATGKPFAHYWMHNGLLTINGEKMAKSLGNYVSLADILKKYEAEVVKFFMLSAHYSHPIDFTYEKMDEAKSARERFYILFDKIDRMLGDNKALKDKAAGDWADKDFAKKVNEHKARFIEVMEDDFNTPLAMGSLFEMLKEINKNPERAPQDTVNAVIVLKDLGSILGLFVEKKKVDASLAGFVDAKIMERNEARKIKDFKKADLIRKELTEKGITIEDTKEGTVWRKT